MSTETTNAPATSPDTSGTGDGGVDASQPETSASVAVDGACVEDWDDVAAFASRHGVTRQTVHDWLGQGRIPGAVKTTVRIVVADALGMRKSSQARRVWRIPPGAAKPHPRRGRHVEPEQPAGTLSAHEVAALTGTTSDWVQAQAHRGRLPHGRANGRYTFQPDVVDLIRSGLPDDPRTAHEAHMRAIVEQRHRILSARFHTRGCSQDGGTLRNRTNGFECLRCEKLRSAMDRTGHRDWTHLR